jgi:hypothetical protein
MDYILLGVDGTGAIGNATYRHDMHNSFVSYLTRNFRGPRKHSLYIRGPGWDGFDLPATVNQGRLWVLGTAQSHRQYTILLVGYSRGGSAVIDVARGLERENINVAGMMLFDAVDRSPTSSGSTISNNVQRVAHAMRAHGTYSRLSFDNCGRLHGAATRYESNEFWCTHGAMGGTPWPVPAGRQPSDYVEETYGDLPTFVSYASDRAGSTRVWGWAQPKLREMGFLE